MEDDDGEYEEEGEVADTLGGLGFAYEGGEGYGTQGLGLLGATQGTPRLGATQGTPRFGSTTGSGLTIHGDVTLALLAMDDVGQVRFECGCSLQMKAHCQYTTLGGAHVVVLRVRTCPSHQKPSYRLGITDGFVLAWLIVFFQVSRVPGRRLAPIAGARTHQANLSDTSMEKNIDELYSEYK
jgi:hypothetical protein